MSLNPVRCHEGTINITFSSSISFNTFAQSSWFEGHPAAIQGGAKVGLQLGMSETQFILRLLFINYCIIFHMDN